MKKTRTSSQKSHAGRPGELTIGIDLGDVWSHYCTRNEEGKVVDRGRFRTTPRPSRSGLPIGPRHGSPWKSVFTRSGSANSFRS
jgi:hypothetical protein